MMVGELAAADCPRAIRLVLQYDTSGNPIHTGMRKPHPQLVYQPHQLTLTHVIVVGAHWVPAAQEATMREASRVRDLEFRSRNRREDDLTIRLENAPLRGGPGRAPCVFSTRFCLVGHNMLKQWLFKVAGVQ